MSVLFFAFLLYSSCDRHGLVLPKFCRSSYLVFNIVRSRGRVGSIYLTWGWRDGLSDGGNQSRIENNRLHIRRRVKTCEPSSGHVPHPSSPLEFDGRNWVV